MFRPCCSDDVATPGLTARVIDGKAIAAALREDVAGRVAFLSFRPGLAVVLVGDDPASAVYVRNKQSAADAVGISARTIHLDAATTEAELLQTIERLNADQSIDGILVQMPLPPQIRSRAITEAIDPAKDVDGLHPLNVGRLAAGAPAMVPCTPLGVMKLLKQAGIPLRGARAVVLGRSILVGKPMAALLTASDATVILAHSRTLDLPAECRRADILVAAVGQPEMVRADWIGTGAVVVDVGINRSAGGRLVGDVAFAECAEVASAITPVPGGVGPMTIASLLENTALAAEQRRKEG
jgi:methylenetetrahydrofolate dehydrogenase (NADP+) / methenyltetrahydrofolate cyclohydrolase